MSTIRHSFIEEVDKATIDSALSSRLDSRSPLCTLPYPAKNLTTDGSEWFHAVDAYADITATRQRVIRIRVITKDHRGVNITIPRTDILYQKFRDLRYQIRNTDYVMIAFSQLYVMGSPFRHELCLRAYDFKLRAPEDQSVT